VTATSKLATPSQDTRRLGSDPLSFDIETTSGVSAGGHEERKCRGVRPRLESRTLDPSVALGTL
jgi:hypothetical protein